MSITQLVTSGPLLLALPVAAAVPVVLRYIGEWRDRDTEPCVAPLP